MRKDRVRIINVPDLSPSDDAFSTLPTRVPVDWVRLSGLPANNLERRFPGVRLSRYRAALQASRASTSKSIVVSHLPLMTAAVEMALAFSKINPPHLAFSFNFTKLPEGLRLAYLQKALRRVTRFVVFSQFERDLYSGLFGIEKNRFVVSLWTQSMPPLSAHLTRVPFNKQPYLCAIGGEGRDFDLLLQAARQLGSGTKIVAIARPDSLAGRTIPDNLHVLTNIPLDETWRIAFESKGVLVPLKTENTACGHITLVSAKLLGLPIVTTRSRGTMEYVNDRDNILISEPGDIEGFTGNMRRVIDDSSLKVKAEKAVIFEAKLHDRLKWADLVNDFVTVALNL